jgi:hypothetical protein
MQELRLVAVSEDGSYAVLVVPGRGGRFSLKIDDRLRAVARGQFSRLAQYEIEVESPLRPKEIQERIRAGETADEIADAAGVPIERVRWFEGPVLAERAYKAQEAQSAMVRRPGDSGPGPTLGEVVTERLTALGTSPEDAHWDSIKRSDGNWQVQLLYSASGRAKTAEWVYDPRRRHATPDGDAAARLSLPESDLPPDPEDTRTEATVTPLQPRLAAPNHPSTRQARRAAEPPPRPHTHPSRTAQVSQPVEPVQPPRPSHAPQPAPQPARTEPAAAESAARPAARHGNGPKPRRGPEPAAQPPAAAVAPAQPERTQDDGQAQDQERAQPAAVAETAPTPAEAARAAQSSGGRRAAGRGKRSSVPSWDEIMFGSSRPRD